MKLRKHTHGLSLLKRRTWYADPPADDQPGDDDAQDAPPAKTPEPRKPDLSTAPTEDLLEEIKKLRKENAERRKKASELEAWKAEQDAKVNKEQDAALLAEKKFQELLDKREKELATIQNELARERIANMKMKIGVELKIPAPLISRLQGDTEDDLRDDAKALIESLGLNQQPQTDEKPQKNPARSQTTTAAPGGQPPTDSPEARLKARRERTPPIFQAGPVRFVNKSEE